MMRFFMSAGFAIVLALGAVGCVAGGEEDLGAATEALLSANTRSLDFGTVALGTPRTLYVTLSNNGAVNDDLTSETSTLPDYTIGTVVPCVRPATAERIAITFRPSSVGTQTGTVTFRYTEGGVSQSPIAVAVTGIGR